MKKSEAELLDELKEKIKYIPGTGEFIRLTDTRNGLFKVGEALSKRTDASGYYVYGHERRLYKHHRLAFLFMTGAFPKMVDHINMIKTDNRWENLREVTAAQNRANAGTRKKRAKKASRYKGVCWDKNNKAWKAQIGFKKKVLNIGSYKTEEEAAKAYDQEAIKLYGDYCRLNFEQAKINYI